MPADCVSGPVSHYRGAPADEYADKGRSHHRSRSPVRQQREPKAESSEPRRAGHTLSLPLLHTASTLHLHHGSWREVLHVTFIWKAHFLKTFADYSSSSVTGCRPANTWLHILTSNYAGTIRHSIKLRKNLVMQRAVLKTFKSFPCILFLSKLTPFVWICALRRGNAKTSSLVMTYNADRF